LVPQAGAILGLRYFKVSVLVPVTLFVAAGVIAYGIGVGLDYYIIIITFDLLAAAASAQVGYVLGSIVAEYLRVQAPHRAPALLHAAQARIGKEPRTVFEIPQEQMNGQHA